MVPDQLIYGLKNVKPGDLFHIPAINKAEDYGFVIARAGTISASVIVRREADS